MTKNDWITKFQSTAHIPHLLLFTSDNPLCCSYVIFYAVALSDRQWSSFHSMRHKFLHLLLFLNSSQPRKFRMARLWSKFKADLIQRPFLLNCKKKTTYTLSLKKGCHTKGFVWLKWQEVLFLQKLYFSTYSGEKVGVGTMYSLIREIYSHQKTVLAKCTG